MSVWPGEYVIEWLHLQAAPLADGCTMGHPGGVLLLFSTSASLLCRQRKLAFISKYFRLLFVPYVLMSMGWVWAKAWLKEFESLLVEVCGHGNEENSGPHLWSTPAYSTGYGQAERFSHHSSLACLSCSSCFLDLRAQPNRDKVSTAYQSQWSILILCPRHSTSSDVF